MHNREGEEDVGADLARVGRRLEKAELDRVLAAVPKVVEVEGAVAGRAVMVVAVAHPVVVGVRQLRPSSAESTRYSAPCVVRSSACTPLSSRQSVG